MMVVMNELDDEKNIEMQLRESQVTREELLLDLEREIQSSRGCRFEIPARFSMLFPCFRWNENGIEFEAKLLFPEYDITQLNKTT